MGITCFKTTGEIISVNAAAAEIAGGTLEQMLKVNFRKSEVFQQSGMLAAADEAIGTGRKVQREFYLSSAHGRSLWLNARLATFTHEGGCHLVIVVSDITEQKRTAAAFQQREERFRILFNSGTTPFLSIRPCAGTDRRKILLR